MNKPITITFRHVEPRADVVELVHQEGDKLLRQHQRACRCRVVIDQVQRRHQHGNILRAEVILNLPHKQLVAKKSLEAEDASSRMKQVVVEAFRAAQRAVSTYQGRRGRRRAPAPAGLKLAHRLAS